MLKRKNAESVPAQGRAPSSLPKVCLHEGGRQVDARHQRGAARVPRHARASDHERHAEVVLVRLPLVGRAAVLPQLEAVVAREEDVRGVELARAAQRRHERLECPLLPRLRARCA